MPQKKKTASKPATKKRKTKKPKIYIPAYKIIIFCISIITICMALLLFTTIKSPEPSDISQRFEEEHQTEKVQPVETEKEQKIETPQVISENKKNKNQSSGLTESESKSKSESVQKTEQKPEKKTVKEPQTSPEKSEKTEKKTVVTENQKKSYGFPAAKNNAQLVFVFDDGGQNLNHLQPFLNIPFPITIAVLPQLPHSVESAKRIREAENVELILHQPMQAVNSSENPGPGAITPDMCESEIRTILFQNINEIGPIAGMNNHEGSAITANAEQMAVIMNIVAENGIFFLDSRTNKDTQVPYVANEMGYSYYERNGFFLDNEKTKENALKELRKNLDIANKNGSVIMIGHIWSANFLPDFLIEVYPELKEKGYTFSTVSKSKAIKY